MDALPDLSQLSSEEKDTLIKRLWEENCSLKETPAIFAKRRAGILLHPTSLPGTLGQGDLGNQAYYFIDFLKECGLSVWQMLPIHPPHRLPLRYPHQDFLSPYQCQCVHAGNPSLISLEELVKKGWLKTLEKPPDDSEMEKVINYRHECLKNAYTNFKPNHDAFLTFKEKNAFWLEDYALFRTIKHQNNHAPWWKWRDEALRNHDLTIIGKVRNQLGKEIDFYRFEQFVFFEQWQALQNYAHQQGVYLFGDMPMFVSEDSVEMWAQRDHFDIKEDGRAQYLVGVSPDEDYFRKKGQCWGNPLYNWSVMQAQQFEWWHNRFKTLGQLFDLVRLTHFRGFKNCWAIPMSDQGCHPRDGHWQSVPGEALFECFSAWKRESSLPLLVAENIVAPGPQAEEAKKLLELYHIPQIKILQLAFDLDSGNIHLPHHHSLSDVLYTGTHDSRTTLGWINHGQTERKELMCSYLGVQPDISSHELLWSLIKMTWSSKVKLTIIPMQDILELGSEKDRMNAPGTSRHNNWRWRFEWTQVKSGMKEKVKNLLQLYERAS